MWEFLHHLRGSYYVYFMCFVMLSQVNAVEMLKYFMNMKFLKFLNLQPETLPFLDSGDMYSFIADYSRLSRLLVTVVLNIMRTNLVARFDKPVLRRLFKSFPEQVVMRTSDEKGKGSEKLFGYLRGCI